MKKTILLSLAVAAAAFTVQAGNLGSLSYHNGNNNKKFTIGVSVGVGVPLAHWGNKATDTDQTDFKDSTHINHGYAGIGFHYDITARYLFGQSVGAMVLIGGNMNSFDASAYSSANGVKSPATITAKSYYMGQYLVGPCGSFGSGNIKFNVRALIGLNTINYPTQTITVSIPVLGTFTEVNAASGSTGFGYQVGAGVCDNLSDAIGLTFNLAYSGTTAKYKNFISTSSGTSFTNTTLTKKMSVGLLTATVGVAINL